MSSWCCILEKRIAVLVKDAPADRVIDNRSSRTPPPGCATKQVDVLVPNTLYDGFGLVPYVLGGFFFTIFEIRYPRRHAVYLFHDTRRAFG
ncbi:hypothetical protein CDEST_09506 [Colletotrichum destructivum]|uniref:Uncharacterized protein n=1 Tax=Colletotrichum destructivum TaxID=34406 RepID=A0AAX4IM77_9PEZI|nr:hypothetical protein CDEST_09506 [Colletotrichum destructivum]